MPQEKDVSWTELVEGAERLAPTLVVGPLPGTESSGWLMPSLGVGLVFIVLLAALVVFRKR